MCPLELELCLVGLDREFVSPGKAFLEAILPCVVPEELIDLVIQFLHKINCHLIRISQENVERMTDLYPLQPPAPSYSHSTPVSSLVPPPPCGLSLLSVSSLCGLSSISLSLCSHSASSLSFCCLCSLSLSVGVSVGTSIFLAFFLVC